MKLSKKLKNRLRAVLQAGNGFGYEQDKRQPS